MTDSHLHFAVSLTGDESILEPILKEAKQLILNTIWDLKGLPKDPKLVIGCGEEYNKMFNFVHTCGGCNKDICGCSEDRVV